VLERGRPFDVREEERDRAGGWRAHTGESKPGREGERPGPLA
jgi:hypothetical protein